MRKRSDNDTIAGSSVTDNITALADDDQITGNKGNDKLNGGDGNDTYYFSLGDGQDTITDQDATVGNVDIINLTDVQTSDVSLSRNGDDLIVNIGTAGDSITVKNWALESDTSYRIEQLQFADGTVWDEATLDTMMNNRAPVAVPVGDQSTTQNTPFTFTFPINSFMDPDAGDTLSLTATQADGTALPSWLGMGTK